MLEHHGACLPSFAALPAAQQRSVRFTQSKMGFNHGWLVQAEAPPGALFGKFKAAIATDGVAASDVAFYFVHWLTDLAGAVPSPLEGSEKFVLKFPQPVLGSFISSFSVVNELANKTETQVFETYLEQIWGQVAETADLGPAPQGDDAIALMRLVVQAQMSDKQAALVAAFNQLMPEDRRVLCDEMARTGCVGQSYRLSQPRKAGGPAILVYYSPAFVRSLSPHTAADALRLLAEIYRRARVLWPLRLPKPPPSDSENEEHAPAAAAAAAAASSAAAGSSAPSPSASASAAFADGGGSVTVRIDQIKELSIGDIQAVYADGDSWLLAKRNELEAVVERHPLDFMAELVARGVPAQVLKFWRRAGMASGYASTRPDSGERSGSRSRSNRTSRSGSRAASGRSTPNSSHSDSSQSIPSFTFRGGHGRGGTSPANVLEDVPAAQLNSEEE